MRVLGPAILCTLIFVCPLSAELVTPVALPPATMEELARVAVTPIPGEHRERDRAARPQMAAVKNAIAATVVIAPLTTAPPPVTRGFQAVTDPVINPVSGHSAPGVDPADPAGAAGPQHVVGVFNNAVTVHDRTGHLLSLITQAQFWHDPSLPDKFLFDPRAAYDAANDRWVIVTLGDGPNPAATNGVLNIAFSTSGDPTAGWRRFRLPVDQTGHLDADVSHLGITADKIVVTVRVFNGDDQIGTTVFTMPKSGAFAGPSLPVTADFRSPTLDLHPLSSDDTTVRMVEWLDETTIRTFELLSSGATANSNVWTAAISVGPDCRQLGSSVVPQCAGILLSGMARDGTMWLVQESFFGAPLVWKIKAGTATTYVIQDSTMSIGFPSIAVNRRGTALVGYGLMSSSIYISAGYSTIDPAGNVSAPAILKSGEAPFNRDRWGDFTTTVVDPVDDLSFWTLGNYANSPLSVDSRWATWWGYIKITDGPARHRPARH